MTAALLDPLVPAEVDLRGYEFMPYYGDRLRDSDLNSRATDAEYRAAHNLWWSSWKQVPAASLPNDDHALCKLADLGRDLKTWGKVRARALHGFQLCSDGRLYHKMLGPLAIEAWQYRNKQRDRTEKARLARLLQNKNEHHKRSVTDSTGEERIGQDSKPAAAITAVVDQRGLSTAPSPNGPAAAADSLVFPENLPRAVRQALTTRLRNHPRGQEALDELAGAMASPKGVKEPVGFLGGILKQIEAGTFMPSHAPRIQVEREAEQLKRELEASGRTENGQKATA